MGEQKDSQKPSWARRVRVRLSLAARARRQGQAWADREAADGRWDALRAWARSPRAELTFLGWEEARTTWRSWALGAPPDLAKRLSELPVRVLPSPAEAFAAKNAKTASELGNDAGQPARDPAAEPAERLLKIRSANRERLTLWAKGAAHFDGDSADWRPPRAPEWAARHADAEGESMGLGAWGVQWLCERTARGLDRSLQGAPLARAKESIWRAWAQGWAETGHCAFAGVALAMVESAWPSQDPKERSRRLAEHGRTLARIPEPSRAQLIEGVCAHLENPGQNNFVSSQVASDIEETLVEAMQRAWGEAQTARAWPPGRMTRSGRATAMIEATLMRDAVAEAARPQDVFSARKAQGEGGAEAKSERLICLDENPAREENAEESAFGAENANCSRAADEGPAARRARRL
jgi:hypothetical protein